VRVHAGSGHLDGAGPIEVVVAQGEGKLLELNLGQGGLVEGHEEVSGAHAALGAFDGHEEKVKLVVSAGGRGALNKISVDDATRGRVL
jgi:hypothetical protein